MRARRLLALAILPGTLCSCVRDPEARTERRIAAVEHGTLAKLGDPPWSGMDLSRRMAHYRVPGVSIAVIDEFEIEWAKGYGVLAAIDEAPVSPQTLFQAASLGKLVVAAGGWHTYPEMASGASMWATPSDLARFAVRVMRSYFGQADEVLSQEMAARMLTPEIDNRGLGPVLGNDRGDRYYFMHPGANDGFKAVIVAYPQRGQGVVIMTNSDNGDALWREILNGVSVEYGWVRDYTYFYVGVTVAMIAAMLGFLALRWRKRIGRSGQSLSAEGLD